MQIRKWLALLVSAALALSLLAGCGGKNQSLGQVILDLLDGQYANVAVEIDPDLEADLRQAVHEGETDEEIRAALEKILGSGVSFRLIGDGQQGDTAWNLILYPGSDPDAAARSAFTEWSKVFGSLPRDGQYSAQIAMIETENGYAILVKATVDKAASRDDDDEPEDLVVKGTGFTYNVTQNTITVELDSEGMQELFFSNLDTKVEAARNNGFEDIIITLKAGTYTVSNTFTTPFKGTLQGESEATITLTGGSGLFAQIDTNGTVENITFEVEKNISDTYTDSDTTCAGAVAGVNNGTISGCEVTINGSISGTNNYSNAGGIVGYNYNEISGCEVTINGSISGGYAGGIAGCNEGTISSCKVNGSDKGISQIDGDKRAGGIAGLNKTSTEGSNKTSTIEGTCTVTNVFINASSGATIHAGGIVGSNEYSSISGTCTVSNCIINAQNTGFGFAYAGGIVGYNKSHRKIGGGIVSGGKVENGTTVSATCNAIASAGGIVGYNSSVHGVDDSSIDNDTCTITATYDGNTVTADKNSNSGIGGNGNGSGSGAFAGTKIGYQAE